MSDTSAALLAAFGLVTLIALGCWISSALPL